MHGQADGDLLTDHPLLHHLLRHLIDELAISPDASNLDLLLGVWQGEQSFGVTAAFMESGDHQAVS